MRGPLAQGGQGAAHQAGLPRDLHHRVPGVVTHLVVGPVVVPVRGCQERAVGDRTAFAPGQAGHRMPAVNRLPGHLTPEPGGTAENK